MKLINRLIILVITFVFMFIMLLLSFYSMGFAQAGSLPGLVQRLHGEIGIGILFLIAFLFGAWSIYPFFTGRQKEATTSITEGDLGQVEITIDALKNMIRGIATQQDEVENVKTEIKAGEEGVHIILSGQVPPSVVIPEVTARLQRLVKSYIEDTTGVNVLDVKVLIENVYEKDKKSRDGKKHSRQDKSGNSSSE